MGHAMTTSITEGLLLTASSVEIEAAAKDARPKISVVAYTGGVMRVPGWGDLAIDLAGLDAGGQVPLLADHDARVGGVVGHGEAGVANGQLLVAGVVSGAGDAAQQIVEMASGGFAFQASVGVEPVRHERVRPGQSIEINGRSLSSSSGFTLVRKGKLREVSITPLGADGGTSVAIAASRKEHRTMDMEVQTTDAETIRTQERERVREINTAFAGLSGTEAERVRASLIDSGATVEDAQREALRLLRDQRPNVNSVRGISGDSSTPDVLASAVLRLAGAEGVAEQAFGASACDRAADLRANTLVEVCAAALRMDGVEPPRGRDAMIRAAFSTASLPVALGMGLEKIALAGFTKAPATWRSIARRAPLSSFREHGVARLAAETLLERIGADGELKHGELSEESSTIKLDTYGKIFTLTRQSIINDDLQLFSDLPRQLGAAASRAIDDALITLILANPGGFFSVGNGNFITGPQTALSIDGLTTAVTTLRTQTDKFGKPLNIQPRFLLVPPELEATARAVLNSTEVGRSDAGPIGNPMHGVAELVVEPRLSSPAFTGSSAMAWYLLTSPSEGAALVGLLNGRESPTVESREPGVNILGLSWRAYVDFGVSLHENRAAVLATGV
jgi:phage major head subunit gpT-like protein